MPKREVDARRPLFEAHGFDPKHLLVDREAGCFDFAGDLADKADLKQRIESDAGVEAKERQLAEVVDS